jgi:tetratricopeptide (TPR) repeat protein
MKLRMRRSKTLGAGFRVSVSKTGFGVSMGAKGARYSVHSSGRATRTVGIPGTGVYASSSSGGGRSQSGGGGAGAGRTWTSPGVQQVVLPTPGWLASGAEKAYHRGIVAALQGDDPAALAKFETVVSQDPAIVSAHLLAATRASVDDAAAVRHLEAVMESPVGMPDRLQAKYLPSEVVRFTARITDNLAVVLPVDGMGATLLLAEFYQLTGRLEEAIGLVQQVYDENPTDPAIVLSLADLLLADQDLEGVVVVTERIDNEDDLSVATLHIRAVALFGLGRADAALEAFRNALAKTSKRDPELLLAVRYDRALILRELGQEAAARKDLERILATDGGYRDVRELLRA